MRSSRGFVQIHEESGSPILRGYATDSSVSPDREAPVIAYIVCPGPATPE